MKKTLVSIITPSLNSKEYIEETINSVINQTYDYIEYIVVDGDSDDGTKLILDKYQKKISKIIIKKDKSMYEAIDRGFKEANGEIISWLNSDDLYFQNAVEEMVNYFESSNAKWAVGKSSKIKNGKIFTYPIPFYYPREIIRSRSCHKMGYGCIPQESVFFKKDLYFSVNGFDKKYKFGGDFDLWTKFANQTSLHSIDKKIGVFRIRKGQISENQESYYKDLGLKYRYSLNIYRFFYSLFLYLQYYFFKKN